MVDSSQHVYNICMFQVFSSTGLTGDSLHPAISHAHSLDTDGLSRLLPLIGNLSRRVPPHFGTCKVTLEGLGLPGPLIRRWSVPIRPISRGVSQYLCPKLTLEHHDERYIVILRLQSQPIETTRGSIATFVSKYNEAPITALTPYTSRARTTHRDGTRLRNIPS